MEHKVVKDMDEEKINLTVKSTQDDIQVKERKYCRLCCGLAVGLLILTGIILLILVFAVFKAKDPHVKINGVKLAHLNITSTTLVPRVRLALDLNITVRNPNRAAFQYTNGSSILYYQNIEVGHADIPAGRLGPGSTITEVVTLNVQAEKFFMGSNFTRDLAAGLVPVSSTTRVSGRLNVLNVYKHHAVSYSWCDMSVFTANATLASFQCSMCISWPCLLTRLSQDMSTKLREIFKKSLLSDLPCGAFPKEHSHRIEQGVLCSEDSNLYVANTM